MPVEYISKVQSCIVLALQTFKVLAESVEESPTGYSVVEADLCKEYSLK